LAVLVLAAMNPTTLFDNRLAVRTPLQINDLGCTHLQPLWLEAQSVPSASLLPCVASRVPGWKVADVAVNDGRTVITLNHDRAGAGAVVLRLTASCARTGAVEAPSQEPVARRFVRVERLASEFSATWWDQFPGGCVTYRLRSTADPEGRFANEVPLLLEALSQRSGGRLQFEPREAR
jgi:hypothetical protein